MYRVYYLLFLLLILYFLTNTYEPFSHNFNYINRTVNNNLCPIQGTIDELDNPVMDLCFRGYYIPYLFNIGTYVSEVPQ